MSGERHINVTQATEWLEGQVASCERLLLRNDLTTFQRTHAEGLLAGFKRDLADAQRSRSCACGNAH